LRVIQLPFSPVSHGNPRLRLFAAFVRRPTCVLYLTSARFSITLTIRRRQLNLELFTSPPVFTKSRGIRSAARIRLPTNIFHIPPLRTHSAARHKRAFWVVW